MLEQCPEILLELTRHQSTYSTHGDCSGYHPILDHIHTGLPKDATLKKAHLLKYFNIPEPLWDQNVTTPGEREVLKFTYDKSIGGGVQSSAFLRGTTAENRATATLTKAWMYTNYK